MGRDAFNLINGYRMANWPCRVEIPLRRWVWRSQSETIEMQQRASADF